MSDKIIPDYTTMQGADMLQEVGDDATKWADAFMQMNPDCTVPQDVMVGWFANAIEHSTDIRNGVVHNGDHMQCLIDNNLSPNGAR